MLIKIINSEKHTPKNKDFLETSINQIFESSVPIGDKVKICGPNITVKLCNIKIIDDRGYYINLLHECYQQLMNKPCSQRTEGQNDLIKKLYYILR